MFKFVKNEKKYWNFIRELRNDSRVQDGFIDKLPKITKEQQDRYMEWNNDNFYVCIEGDSPVGYIRNLGGDIGVCTHPDHWGRGI